MPSAVGQADTPTLLAMPVSSFGPERGDLTDLLNHFGPNLRVVAFQFGDARVLANQSPITGGFVALGHVLGQR